MGGVVDRWDPLLLAACLLAAMLLLALVGVR